jgi:hypothetical protein
MYLLKVFEVCNLSLPKTTFLHEPDIANEYCDYLGNTKMPQNNVLRLPCVLPEPDPAALVSDAVANVRENMTPIQRAANEATTALARQLDGMTPDQRNRKLNSLLKKGFPIG